MLAQPDPNATLPFLEYYSPAQGGAVQRIVLDSFPFLLGRSPAAHLVISSGEVSKKHALIDREGADFRIRDLGSTNGTFVNGQRITDANLCHNDILHVAREEFRFIHPTYPAPRDSVLRRTAPAQGSVPTSLIRGSEYLQEMLAQQAVRVIYQPIVSLETREPFGYEALARGTHAELSAKPGDLLDLASQCGMASSLSRMFRQAAAEEGAQLPEGTCLFLNFHPAELLDESLYDSLRDLRRLVNPLHTVALEIPETAVTDLATIRKLRQQLKEFGFFMAYDDFGAGQARFLELAEEPPDFVKIGMRLVRNIHESEGRQNLLRALSQVGADLQVRIIAEGIEARDEAQVCRDLGCHLGQGYWFGRPVAVGLLHQSLEATHNLDLTPSSP